MSAYPMQVRSVSMDHTGGTKSYHLLLVTTADGRSLFVSRWGKTGAFGEMKPETFPTSAGGEKAWDKKERQKASGGYRQHGAVRVEAVNDAGDLRRAIGIGVWGKVGAAALKHLDPSLDTSGMREADPVRVNEDGTFNANTSRNADLSAQIAAEKEAQRIESENVLRANPLFGKFG